MRKNGNPHVFVILCWIQNYDYFASLFLISTLKYRGHYSRSSQCCERMGGGCSCGFNNLMLCISITQFCRGSCIFSLNTKWNMFSRGSSDLSKHNLKVLPTFGLILCICWLKILCMLASIMHVDIMSAGGDFFFIHFIIGFLTGSNT